jgi:hypothetical protein
MSKEMLLFVIATCVLATVLSATITSRALYEAARIERQL